MTNFLNDTEDPTSPTHTNTSSSSSSVFDELNNIFTDFDKNMETTIKRTPRLPTAEEFLGDFENAFNTKLNTLLATSGILGAAGGLGPNEAEFARNVLFPSLMAQYQGRLGAIAKTGQSPFRTADGGSSYSSSVSNFGQSSNSTGTRSRSGTETTTSKDSDGNSVTNSGPTSSTGNVNDTETTSGHTTDNQTIQEDILLPKIMPMDFLDEVLTPGAVRVAYEGSRRGAGNFQSAGTGTTIARRV